MNNGELTNKISEEQLLKIDYQNIQNNDNLNQIADVYRSKIQEVLEQIKEYSNILGRNKQQHHIVTEKMKQLKSDYQLKNIELNAKIENAKHEFQSQIKEITDDHEKTLKTIEQKTQQYIKNQQEIIKNLFNTLEAHKDREIQEYSYLNQIEEKTKGLIESQYAHHDNMNVQESMQSKQTNLMIEKNIELIKDLKKNAKTYAEEVVIVQKQENQDKNYELKYRLMALQSELHKLRKQRNILVQNKKQTKINISINEEELEEYKAVGSLQKSKIKMYQDKIQYIKKNIANQLSKLESKIKDKKTKWENQMKGMKMKLYGLQKKKDELRINLEKYKILGETILMQREEIQEFFVIAIQECKEEMTESGPMQENNERQYGQKVDIDELSPKDRHRILTNLYTKLALGPK